MRAHMHLRGKAFQFRAIYPNGETEILLDIPKYDFKLAALLLSGSAQDPSPWNPNRVHRVLRQLRQQPVQSGSSAVIRWGPQTWDEMMIGWLDIAVPVAQEHSLRASSGHSGTPESKSPEARFCYPSAYTFRL